MERVSTGIAGLDRILQGGFIRESAYLVRGGPGQGKTTLGLHFLSAADENEESLFIGFQESDEQLRRNAEAVGIDVSRITFLNLSPDEKFFTEEEKYDVFSAAEVEQTPLSESIVEAVERLRPSRVFIDSLTQLRYLSSDVYQYRKEVLSFLHFLKSREATIVFTSEHSEHLPDDDLQYLADGVISFTHQTMGQAIRVNKFRGSGFSRGLHQMRNSTAGVEIFPRPVPPKEELIGSTFELMSTGLPPLDKLLGGGLESGTISMVTGPSGIGKSTLASCIAAEVAKSGGHVAIYLFEEEASSFRYRATKLGIDLEHTEKENKLLLEQVEPLRYLADEFATKVYEDVINNKSRLVIFDSTAGFQMTLADESIRARLHALAKSLSRMNISVLLINETTALYGEDGLTEKGISYLADNVIVLSYIRERHTQASTINIMKKRLSDFDRRVYRFTVGPKSIDIPGVYQAGDLL